MGRVTFQDPRVVERVQKGFVATWINAAPGYQGAQLKTTGEDLAEAFAAWWPSGRASTNVRTLVATADGELLHSIPGFVKPGELLRELDFAQKVAEKIERAGKDPAARRKAFVAAHEARLAELEARFGKSDSSERLVEARNVDDMQPDYFGKLLMNVHRGMATSPECPEGEEVKETINQAIRQQIVAPISGSAAAIGGVGTPGVMRPGVQSAALRVGVPMTGAALTTAPGMTLAVMRTPSGRFPGSRVRTGGGGAAPPTGLELEAAHRALETRTSVTGAIAAFATRETDVASWKSAVADVKAAGTPALRDLLLEATTSAQSEKAYAVLRWVTGEVIPNDEDAWTKYVADR